MAGEYRLAIVSGTCCGYDRKAMINLKKAIREYEKEHHISLDDNHSYRDMEENLTLCYSLKEISAEQQKVLIQQLQGVLKRLKQEQPTDIKENYTCRGSAD